LLRRLFVKIKLCAFPGNSEDVLVPTLVSGLKGHHVVDVACGSGDAQTLAVTKDGKSPSTLYVL
jgi:ubiquinone/menaquinone biosynthesis C-methylase UbiE